MKRLFSFCLFVMLLTTASITLAAPQGNANVVGAWDMTIDSPQGTRTPTLIIKQEGDKLVGVMKSPQGERPLKSLTLQGNDITMVMTIMFQGDEMTITYKGKVENDAMKGNADFGGLASGTWSAVPHKEASEQSPAAATSSTTSDISGEWSFTVELDNGGKGAPTFMFKQEGEKLTGTYKGPLGEAPVTGTINGADVKFSYKLKREGTEMEGKFTGKVTAKDAMAGTVSFSVSAFGSGKWTAKKKQ